jgi:ABC-2 type transport system permease protein
VSGMLANVFLKNLRDQRRALVGWGLGLVLLVLGMSAIWPTFRDMPGLEELMAGYPEYMLKLFNVEELTTGAGYVNAELFSIILPALFIIYGIGRGARLIAGEEEAGTLETLLATPVSRARILLEKAAALAAGVAILGAVLFGVLAVASPLFGLEVGTGQAAAATFVMVLIGVEHGWLALAVGAATGRRALAVAVASTVAVAGYVLYAMGALVESIEPWQPLSPFAQALEGGPIGGGVPAVAAWMLAAGIVFVAVAVPAFRRRDIVAH